MTRRIVDQSQFPDLAGWDQVAGELGVTRDTAIRYASSDDDPLPVYRLKGRIYAYREDIRQWLFRNLQPFAASSDDKPQGS